MREPASNAESVAQATARLAKSIDDIHLVEKLGGEKPSRERGAALADEVSIAATAQQADHGIRARMLAVVAQRHSSLLKDFAPLAGRDIRLTASFGF